MVLALVREGVVDGLRIDHPDGLADPAQYFARLREAGVRARVDREDPRVLRAAARLAGGRHRRLRVPQRRLRAVRRPGVRAGVHGAVAGGLGRHAHASPRWRRRPSSSRRPGTFAREIERLAARAGRRPAAAPTRWPAAVASLPGLPTYVVPGRRRAGEARSPTPTARPWPRAGCRPRSPSCCCSSARRPAEFVTRFQQTTPPVVAKGVEDTAFYRYGRLLALCDVGGDPGRFGIAVDRLPRRPRRARASASRWRC